MNYIKDQGIILSVRPHGEGGAVVHVLSCEHGKYGGYVNGAQSSPRLRSLLQSGNIVSFEWLSKTEGQLGRFDLELEKDISAIVLDNAKALLSVQSVCGLMDMFVPDREIYTGLFHGTAAFFDILKSSEWQPAYIMWEMAFLKELGYGLDLSKCAVCGTTDHLTHVSPKTGRAVCYKDAQPYIDKLLEIPNFLQGQDLERDDFIKGLKLTRYFLIHRVLQHSSYHELPYARIELENSMDSA